MKKLVANMQTDGARAFWASVTRSVALAKNAPPWKKAGIILNDQHYVTFAPSSTKPDR